ncbi:MAG TPA: DUF3810 family protein [Vicinamibacterales bacterium]
MRWRAAVVALAAAAALIPLPPSAIERVYSGGIYPVWQPLMTAASNATTKSVFDLLIVGVLAMWLVVAAADIAKRRWRAIAPTAVRTVVWCAVAYLAFLASWGLNYRRVPLADKLAFERSRVSADSARALATTAVAQVNGLYRAAHAEGFPADGVVDPRLASAFDRAQRELGAARTAVAGRPKHSWLDPYFRRAVVDGMTDPFFLETLTSSDLLPFERTFVIAHEWAHLAGYANEGEANFVGWITCLRGDEGQQYSGWLFLYGEVAATLTRRERADVSQRLADGPRADLAASAERVARNVSPRVADAGWRVYNQYLKANRVEAGTRSYSEVVQLILGTRYRADAMRLVGPSG